MNTQNRDSQNTALPAAGREGQTSSIRPTMLLETVHTLSRMAVIGVGISVALLAATTGSEPLIVAVRAGGAMLGVGLLLWFINWVLHRAVLEMARSQLAEAAGQSTTEWEA